MKQFRDSFFKHFGIEQADIILVNDGMSIEKQLQSRHPVRQVLIQRNRAP